MKSPLLLISLCCTLLLSVAELAQAENQRIAVAGGSMTEIIYRLGEQHRIVGVDSTSQFPKATEQHPILGYVRNISTEGVLSLKPDLLLGEVDTGPTKVVNQLKAAGVNTVLAKDDDTIPALKEKIRLVATLLGTEEKGEQLIEDIQVDLDALAYGVKRKTQSPRVLFLLSLSNGAPVAAGHTTSAHTAITEAGGINVLEQHEGWHKLSPESALALMPDVIVAMDREEDELKQVNSLPHFRYTPAVKNKAVYTIDGNYLLGFGPRTPQAIVELGTMIHPEFALPPEYSFRYPNSPHAETASE